MVDTNASKCNMSAKNKKQSNQRNKIQSSLQIEKYPQAEVYSQVAISPQVEKSPLVETHPQAEIPQAENTSKKRSLLPLITCLYIAFHAFLAWPRVYQNKGLLYGWLGASAFITTWLLYLYLTRSETRQFTGEWKPRKPHIVQFFAQSSVFMSLAWFWPVAWNHLPFMFAQFCFAYLVDIALALSKNRAFRIGLGAIPITISTNLFLFFRDDYFYLQWVLITFGLASRELFRWKRNGVEVHIFNPSAITLSVMGILLIFTHTVHWSWGPQIASNHGINPYGYEVIFLAGLLVQSFFSVGIMTMTAAMTSWALCAWYFQATGIHHYVNTVIPIAVFLGMNLLFTDPASTPRNNRGKLIYGVLYGAGVFFLYDYLRDMSQPMTTNSPGVNVAFFDKLLFVPVLNLSVRWIEDFAEKKIPAIPMLPPVAGRIFYLALWATTFIVFFRPLFHQHPGNDLAYWEQTCDAQELPHRKLRACENRNLMYRVSCEAGAWEACNNLGISFETGEYAKADRAQAAQLYEKACQANLPNSCMLLGSLLYQEGVMTKENAWFENSEKYLKKACDLKLADACVRLSNHEISEWKEPKNWQNAKMYLQQACDLKEPTACFELAKQNLRSWPQNQQACQQGGDGFACMLISDFAGQDERKALAKKQLTTACDGGVSIACANLGWMYWLGDGNQGVSDQKLALQYLDQACQFKMNDACIRAKAIRDGTAPKPNLDAMHLQEMMKKNPLMQAQPQL